MQDVETAIFLDPTQIIVWQSFAFRLEHVGMAGSKTLRGPIYEYGGHSALNCCV